MSFWNFIFGTAKRKEVSFDEKSKLSRRDIINLVWRIKSLDSQQKKLVQEELEGQLDDGGLSKWEYREIIRQLSLRRRELGLSEIDIRNLKRVL